MLGAICAEVHRGLAAGKPTTLSVYNPQMTARPNQHVELLVPAAAAVAGLSVVSAAGGKAALPCQISHTHTGDASVVLLTFQASLLPLGLHSFVVGKAASKAASCAEGELQHCSWLFGHGPPAMRPVHHSVSCSSLKRLRRSQPRRPRCPPPAPSSRTPT